MPKREYTVDRMHRGEQSAVVGALTRAFYDDPLFGFFLPDLVHQTKGILAFMGAASPTPSRSARSGSRTPTARSRAAAVWLPPGAYPRGARRELMTNLRGLPAFARIGRRTARELRLLNAVDKAHHDDRRSRTTTSRSSAPIRCIQRTGAGSAALQPVLDRCDDEGFPRTSRRRRKRTSRTTRATRSS